MFTQKLFKWIVAFTLLTVVAFGNLPGIALADGPENEVTDANTYISYLDSLRQAGQAEAAIATALHIREKAVFDHSSDLNALHDRVVVMRIAAGNRPLISDANGYISHLAQLETMSRTTQTDATGYISHLEQLRQKGLDGSEVGSAKFAQR